MAKEPFFVGAGAVTTPLHTHILDNFSTAFSMASTTSTIDNSELPVQNVQSLMLYWLDFDKFPLDVEYNET